MTLRAGALTLACGLCLIACDGSDAGSGAAVGEACTAGACEEFAVCVDAICRRSCTDDLDCLSADESCEAGACVPATAASCGNGTVELGETCDTAGESSSCDADCTAVVCGDGVINEPAGEQCEGSDGCGDCLLLPCVSPASTRFAGAPFAAPSDRFEVVWEATPAVADLDASVVLTPSSASDPAFTDCATLVRFFASGTIDARDGDAFAAAATVTYAGGSTYRIRQRVDLPSHRYTVWVTPPSGGELLLADGFAFRSEQQAATEILQWGVRSYAGELSACLVSVTPLAEEPTPDANFTTGEQTAAWRGVHEIELGGDGSLANPFLTEATVTFTPPSGAAGAVTVTAFYDGGDTWRARAYVSEIGSWTWSSASADDAGLDGQTGSFTAVSTDLPGRLARHASNPKSWMSEDGATFLNFADTAYRLFNSNDAEVAAHWQDYVAADAAQGITSLRVAALGGYYWADGRIDQGVDVANYPWDGTDYSRFHLIRLQTTDARLRWLLDHHPRMYVQLILFGLVEWGQDLNGGEWDLLSAAQKRATVVQMMARWAAFPQLFWLIVNDMHSLPGNLAFAEEVGALVQELDPYAHLLSSGPNRDAPFPFADSPWASYVHIEVDSDLAAVSADDYSADDLHVYMGEDRYENDRGAGTDPPEMAYFQRRLYLAWLLAGGSATYGGRFPCIHPYDETDSLACVIRGETYDTALVGLGSLPHVAAYFRDRALDLAAFTPADGSVSLLPAPAPEGDAGPSRAKAMRRANDELLIYLPCAADGESAADVGSRRAASLAGSLTPAVNVDLGTLTGSFAVEWYDPATGDAVAGSDVTGGGVRTLTSPWIGRDVLLRLSRP